MRKLKRRKKTKTKKQLIKKHDMLDMDDEKYLLAFMLMSDDVADAAYRYYTNGQLRLANISKLYKRQYRDVFDYYEKYHHAPRRTIKYMLEGHKPKIANEELEIDQHILTLVADEYAAAKEGYNVNDAYIIDHILPRLIRTRKIQLVNLNLQNAINNGNFEQAEELIKDYEVTSPQQQDAHMGFTTPLNKESYQEFISKRQNPADIAFKFDASLGDIALLIPPLRKQWLVSVTGTTKSGKSFFLWRMAMDAVLNQNKKVMFLNMEMSEYDTIERRTIPYLSKKPIRADKIKIGYWETVIDCLHNQQSTCPIYKRGGLNNHKLYTKEHINQLNRKNNPEQLVVSFRKWKTCKQSSRCRKCIKNREHFIPAIYFKYRKGVTTASEQTKLAAFDNYTYENTANLRVNFFPKYSVTINEQIDNIKRFMDKHKFTPDIVIWDYLDISRIKTFSDVKRWEAIDDIWKLASGFVQEINALGISADQTKQSGRTKRLLDETTTSEASMKDHHIDLKIGLIKSKEETFNNICRVNVIYDRHHDFDRRREVLITQNLTIADAITDSVFWPHYNMPPYPICLPQI